MAWRQIESVTQRIPDGRPREECRTDPASEGAASPGGTTLKCRVRRAARWVHYFPVDLSQLAARDPEHFPGGETYYSRAARLATAFWTRDDDVAVLADATQKILTTEQTPWSVGTCGRDVKRLADAVAYSVIRASSANWDALDQAALRSPVSRPASHVPGNRSSSGRAAGRRPPEPAISS